MMRSDYVYPIDVLEHVLPWLLSSPGHLAAHHGVHGFHASRPVRA